VDVLSAFGNYRLTSFDQITPDADRDFSLTQVTLTLF
jgi:hypothetical protein